MESPGCSLFCLADYTFGCSHSSTSLRYNNLLGQPRAQESSVLVIANVLQRRQLANEMDVVLVTSSLLWPDTWQETASRKEGLLWLMTLGRQSIWLRRRGSWGRLAHIPDEETEKRICQSSIGLFLSSLLFWVAPQFLGWGYTHIHNKSLPPLTLRKYLHGHTQRHIHPVPWAFLLFFFFECVFVCICAVAYMCTCVGTRGPFQVSCSGTPPTPFESESLTGPRFTN